ncbi:MAG: polyhydroxyalkanoate depolymerase [Vulcanimicrobiota bacterium]
MMIRPLVSKTYTPPRIARASQGPAQAAPESDRFSQANSGCNPWLYQAHEAGRLGQKMWFSSLAAGLSMQSAVASFWGFPGTAMLDASRQLCDRVAKDYDKPSFGLEQTTIGGETVAVREEVVTDKAFGRLLHFQRDTQRNDPKLLLVAPLSGHYATLLRSTVEELLPNHDVYITDWKNARDVPLAEGDFGVDDYISYVKEFIGDLGPGANVLAVCQPTVPTLAAVARLAQENSPHQPASLTLMGGPVDSRAAASEVTEFAQSKPIEFFEQNLIGVVPGGYAGAGRKVYPGFMQLAAFMSMNPSRHLSSHAELWKDLATGNEARAQKTEEFYDEYLAVLDLPARFYLETVQEVFQDQDLAKGQMTHFGAPVDPAAIRKTALLTVEGERDDISPPGQTTAAHQLCSGLAPDQHQHYLQEGAGHYGIFSGSKWRREVAPHITSFIRQTAEKNGQQFDAVSAQA